MYQIVLTDLKSRFGDKVLLSPEEVAPIIAINTDVQANMRSQGSFPIPIRKIGKKVGISIFHLAEFIAYGYVASEVEKPLIKSIPKEPTVRINTSKRSQDWLRAFEIQIQYQFELATAIRYELLRASTSASDKDGPKPEKV